MPKSTRFSSVLLLGAAALCCTGFGANANAQSALSAASALSALPVASVLVSTESGHNPASVLLIPPLLLVGGASLVVKSVEASAKGTVYVFERASDGSRASVEVLSKGVGAASLAVGTVATVSAIGAGIIVSAAGQVIAFIPNELGKALLHSERVTS